jgi:hypothetical protein
MLASSLRIGFLAAAAVAASAGAAPMPIAPAVPARLAVSELPREAPAADMMGVDCVRGFSKDFCGGVVYPGHGVESSCGPVGAECKTLRVSGATMDLPFRRNLQLCAVDGKCDEAERKDGSFKVALSYTLRLQKPCQYRGCLEGSGDLRAVDGSVYSGNLQGTIGVGSHRPFSCPVNRTSFCEKCIDVEYIPASGLWRIGWEGSFHGKRSDVADGTEVCFTMSGDFYAAGDANGPFDLTGNLRVFGTADGIFLDSCFP